MTKRVTPVAKAVVVVALGSLVVLAGASAFRTQEQQQDSVATAEPYEAPVDVDTAGLAGPRQPIFYRHDVHAGQYEMDCQYCHSYAEISSSPGLPSIASCMGCHLIVGATNPEVQKLREAYNNGQTIEWNEVHRLSQFVHFPHMRHVVNGEIECQECHGEIERMPQVFQFASLKMGWCLDCHNESTYADDPERPVTTDCSACHY